mgnify:CR=1 FL=1
MNISLLLYVWKDLVLNNPAFTKYLIQYGEISTYPGGYKENAGDLEAVPLMRNGGINHKPIILRLNTKDILRYRHEIPSRRNPAGARIICSGAVLALPAGQDITRRL